MAGNEEEFARVAKECFVIYDSATVGEGNLLMYGTLSTPRSVETATIMTIKEGYLSLSAQNPT